MFQSAPRERGESTITVNDGTTALQFQSAPRERGERSKSQPVTRKASLFQSAPRERGESRIIRKECGASTSFNPRPASGAKVAL